MRFIAGLFLGAAVLYWWYEWQLEDEDDGEDDFPFLGSNTEHDCEIRWHRGAGNGAVIA